MLKLTDNINFNNFFLILANINLKKPYAMKNSTHSTHTHTQARSSLNLIYFVVYCCFVISAYSPNPILF